MSLSILDQVVNIQSSNDVEGSGATESLYSTTTSFATCHRMGQVIALRNGATEGQLIVRKSPENRRALHDRAQGETGGEPLGHGRRERIADLSRKDDSVREK